MEGLAVYCAAKAAMEQWVRVVRAERRRLQAGPWVLAVRPGFVATEAVWDSHADPDTAVDDYPGRAAVAAALAAGDYLTPESAARQIWDLMPPDPDGRNVLYVGEMVEGATVEVTSPPT